MTEAFILLGPECNQNCLFCYTTESKRLSTEEAKSFIDKYIKMEYKWISFTGGEPTVRNDLPELIKYTKAKGANTIKIQTNGLRISNKHYLKSLTDFGVNRVYISLLSDKPNIHNQLTQTPKSFEKTIKALENLEQFKIPVEIGLVITTLNFKRLENFLIFLNKKFDNIESYQFLLFCPQGRGLENSHLIPRLKYLEAHLIHSLQYAEKNKIILFTRSVPLCYMQGFEKHSVETNTLISHRQKMIISDFPDDKPKHSFEYTNSKAPQCNFCFLNNKCGGTWRMYLTLFGSEELFPVYKVIK